VKIRVNISIDKDLLERLDVKLEKDRYNRSEWVSKAIRDYLTEGKGSAK